MYDFKQNTYKEENVSKTITDLDIVFGIHPLSKDDHFVFGPFFLHLFLTGNLILALLYRIFRL